MADEKANKKWPHSPHHDAQGQDAQGVYADNFYQYETCHMGTHYTKYRDPNGKKNFDSKIGITGDLEHHEQNSGEPTSLHFYPKHSRKYSGNDSDHTQDNKEGFVGSVDNKGSGGQRMRSTASDEGVVAVKKQVHIRSDFAGVETKSNHVDTSGTSSHFRGTSGTGSEHHDSDGVVTHNALLYHVHKGDHGSYTESNVDHMAKKSMQHQAGDTLTLKAGSSTATIKMDNGTITLTVGGSSIKMESGQITVKSGKIILDGETHCGGSGGEPAKQCGGGCASKTMVN